MSKVWTELRDKGLVHRSGIGLYPETITATGLGLPQDWGVIAADVTPDGPADKAGVQPGDIVLNLSGKPMENGRQMAVDLYRYSAGQTVTLEVLRDGKKLTLSVAVVNREDDPMRFADMVDPVKNQVPKLGILGLPIDRGITEAVGGLRNPYGVVVAAHSGGLAHFRDRIDGSHRASDGRPPYPHPAAVGAGWSVDSIGEILLRRLGHRQS